MAAPAATYAATLKVAGAAIAFTGEACASVAGNTYRMTDTTKRLFDPDTTPSWYENGNPTAQSVTINYFTGTVTFAGAASAPITVDGKYLPVFTAVATKSFEWTVTVAAPDVTTLDSSGFLEVVPTLIDASGSFLSLDYFTTDLDAGGPTVTLEALYTSRSHMFLQHGAPSATEFNQFRVRPADISTSMPLDGVMERSLSWVLDSYEALDGTTMALDLAD